MWPAQSVYNVVSGSEEPLEKWNQLFCYVFFPRKFFPFTHVVYLVRDPRAVLNSLVKPLAKNEFRPGDRTVKNVCTNLVQDLDELEAIQRLAKGVPTETTPIMLVKYENLVTDPLGVGKNLVGS